MRNFLNKETIKLFLLNLPMVRWAIWRKMSRPVKVAWAKILINSSKIEARWKQKVKGGTWYVVMINWHDVRCMSKQQYDYCKKFIKKRYGKDLKKQLLYRADGTLIRNPDYVGNL